MSTDWLPRHDRDRLIPLAAESDDRLKIKTGDRIVINQVGVEDEVHLTVISVPLPDLDEYGHPIGHLTLTVVRSGEDQ